MKTSNEIANIAKALCEAQKKINHATKDSKNPHFKSDYASLESVIDATKDSLLEQGIVVVQSVEGSTLETRLQHSSGEYFESVVNLIMQKNDMPGLGSAITYARRYQLAAMLNISQADDDGNASVPSHKVAKPVQQQAKQPLAQFQDVAEYVLILNKDKSGKEHWMTGTKLKDHKPQVLFDFMRKSVEWHDENKRQMNEKTKEINDAIEAYLLKIDFMPF